MRVRRILAVAVATPLLLGGLTACNSSSQKCKNDRCEVTVKASSSILVEVLDIDFTFNNLQDDSVKVTQGTDTKVLKEGQTARVGKGSVQVVDADPGEARLVITR
jgi:hypothetical protein